MPDSKQNKKISVVMAAWNEEPRIGNVLKVVKNHPLIDEIIVIDDGSKDKTSEVAKKYGVRLIQNEQNMGKTLSVKKGIEAAKNELVFLLDADLNGLTLDDVSRLAEPVLDGEVDWTLSIRGNSVGFMKFAKMDWISGERIVPKELLADPYIWSRSNISYGLETLMNESFLNRKTTFRSVYLPNLTITHKAEKDGFIKGWTGEFRMFSQMSKVLPIYRIFWQFITMARLNKKYSRIKKHV